MDVHALYPSLDLEDILEAVMAMVENTELSLEDVDSQYLATYLAVMVSKTELEEKGLSRHIPRRTVELEGKQKAAPTIAYLDSSWYYSSTKGKGRARKEKWNWEQWQEPGQVERKVMVALMLREQVRVLVTNHLYTTGGKLYHQLGGGPIGERITTILARMVMYQFDIRFLELTNRLKVPLLLSKRYVDDVNAAGRALDRKTSVKVREGVASLEQGEEDTDLEDDAHTASIYRDIANTVLPRSVVMEEDVASEHPGKKLPILDMETWVEDSSIKFQFFRKPMSSRAVVMARSAFTTRNTMVILLAEGDRRRKSCSPDLPWETKAWFLTDLSIHMMDCGHSQSFRDIVISRVVAKYLDSLARHMSGERPCQFLPAVCIALCSWA